MKKDEMMGEKMVNKCFYIFRCFVLFVGQYACAIVVFLPSARFTNCKSCKLMHMHTDYCRGVERADLWPYNQCSVCSSALYKGAASASQILLQMPEQSQLMRMLSIHPLSLANAEFTLASAPRPHTDTHIHGMYTLHMHL